MDVSLLQEKSVLTMRMSPHLEPFFFLIYDFILHKCCAISNQYHFTNPISTFLPKFQGGPDPSPPSGSAHEANAPMLLSCLFFTSTQHNSLSELTASHMPVTIIA